MLDGAGDVATDAFPGTCAAVEATTDVCNATLCVKCACNGCIVSSWYVSDGNPLLIESLLGHVCEHFDGKWVIGVVAFAGKHELNACTRTLTLAAVVEQALSAFERGTCDVEGDAMCHDFPFFWQLFVFCSVIMHGACVDG